MFINQIIIANKNKNLVKNRFMFSGNGGDKLNKLFTSAITKASKNSVQKSEMAGKFSIGRFNKGTKKGDGTPEDKHMLDHDLLVNNEVNHAVGVLTSSHNPPGERISNVKVDGSFTSQDVANAEVPVTNNYGYQREVKKVPKREGSDDFGYVFPSKSAGGQYLRPTDPHRSLGEGVFIEDKTKTSYADEHEEILNVITSKPTYTSPGVQLTTLADTKATELNDLDPSLKS